MPPLGLRSGAGPFGKAPYHKQAANEGKVIKLVHSPVRQAIPAAMGEKIR